MALIDTAIVFVVSLLIGAAAIYVGARIIVDESDFTYAIVSALIASIVWSVVAFFVGWIPLLGPLLALVAYIGVINWRYPGGWMQAGGIALIAWLISLVILYVLATIGFIAPGATGVLGS
ncbi:hypothetical protein [Halopelagius longus]|uniref:Uncharacterized protein n=1 Tax=Halopelagius longus TaxID=1236180 RepID=A0A1H1GMQ0_9EURY|nr:hypothetical protein [Halopelagius longus]RDI69664.1 hypothetical protein DWB78_18000 [Halopelagius longus]SDR14158.1 hypothetical protein SAMN05216278_3757 [Halopelagius longus]